MLPNLQSYSAPVPIPSFRPDSEVKQNTSHRVRNRILRREDAALIMEAAVDHYVSGRRGEISRAVSRRTHHSQEIVDAVIVAAFLEVRGELAVCRHCETLAAEMARERRAEGREEFKEWFRNRTA